MIAVKGDPLKVNRGSGCQGRLLNERLLKCQRRLDSSTEVVARVALGRLCLAQGLIVLRYVVL